MRPDKDNCEDRARMAASAGDDDDTEETDEEREERERREAEAAEKDRAAEETRKSVETTMSDTEQEVEMVPITDTALGDFITDVVKSALSEGIEKAIAPLQEEIAELRKAVDTGAELTKGVQDFLDEAAQTRPAGSGRPAGSRVTPLIKNATDVVLDDGGEPITEVDPDRLDRVIAKGMNHIEPLMEKGIDIFKLSRDLAQGVPPSETRLKHIEEVLETL